MIGPAHVAIFQWNGKGLKLYFFPRKILPRIFIDKFFYLSRGAQKLKGKTIFFAFQYTHKIVRKPSKSDLPLINSHVLIQDLCNLSIYCAGFHDDLIMPVT